VGNIAMIVRISPIPLPKKKLKEELICNQSLAITAILSYISYPAFFCPVGLNDRIDDQSQLSQLVSDDFVDIYKTR
jgi:hypothetical protein